MAKPIQNAQQRKIKEARLKYVSEVYKKGYSIQTIADMTREFLGMETGISKQTIHSDIKILLKEWRKDRIDNIDTAIQLELERIDMAVIELWEAWERSKTNQTLKFTKQKGSIDKSQGGENEGHEVKIKPTFMEKGSKETVEFGDYRYITEIRFQLMERRKLLGLYAPEKTELTGKDGQPLNPPAKVVNLDSFTEEEKAQLLQIARKVEK